MSEPQNEGKALLASQPWGGWILYVYVSVGDGEAVSRQVFSVDIDSPVAPTLTTRDDVLRAAGWVVKHPGLFAGWEWKEYAGTTLADRTQPDLTATALVVALVREGEPA